MKSSEVAFRLRLFPEDITSEDFIVSKSSIVSALITFYTSAFLSWSIIKFHGNKNMKLIQIAINMY